jgi:hypothetical protein
VVSDRQKATEYFIVLVDPEHADVADLNRAIAVEHGAVEIKDTSFSGLPVKHALIITSKRRAAPVVG